MCVLTNPIVRPAPPHIRSRFRRLDALVCNAGLANTPGRSKEGFELHMATNYLGHFYLCKLLLDVLKATEGRPRVVTVSSLMHEFGCLDFKGSLDGCYRSWKDVRSFLCPLLVSWLVGWLID